MKSLHSCRKGKEFVRYAKKNGAIVEPGKGSHQKVRTKKGVVVVPVGHSKEIGRGLRSAIIKQFAAIGIMIIVGCIWLNLGA